MTFLPIVERELRVASRLSATFRNRTLTAGVVAAVAFLMLFFAGLSGAPSLIGETTFLTLGFLTLCFCLLEGVRKTSDCLSEEKRDGTLGLLFLTDLKGYDVVFGKLAATSLNSFYGLVAILPLLALPLLLGGVTPGEYWRVVLALLNILFFSLAAGMAVSSRSLRQQQAMGWTALVIVLFTAIPWLTFAHAIYPFSPVYGFVSAFATNYPKEQGGYWESLGFTQLWSWLLLVWASLSVPRSWRENETSGPWRATRRSWLNWRLGRAESREEMLARNPILWLAARNQDPTPALNICMIIALVGAVVFAISAKPDFLIVYAVCAVLLNFFLKILIATQSTRFFAEARRENDLEMLLATPLRVDQFIGGQLLALERLFLVPVMTIFAIEFVGGFIGIIVASHAGPAERGVDTVTALFVGGMIYLGIFLLDAAALTWAGMWFGLTSKKETSATTKTILFVLIAPLVALLLWCPGYVLFFGIPIFWITWASSHLHRRLRVHSRKGYNLLPIDYSKQLSPTPAPPHITPPTINL